MKLLCREVIMLLFVNVCMMLNLMIGRYCVVIALGNMKTTELQNLYLIISYAPTIRLVADDWLLYLDWRLLNTVVIDMDFIDRNRRNMMMMTFLPDI